MVNLSYETNSEGGGVAWREDGYVHWHKGLDLEEMRKYCKNLPLPFIAHFRIASIGGKSKELCHPFPIEKDVPLVTKGKTNGFVLFHNGHWGAWKNDGKEAAFRSGTPIPPGKWSDTRAMAFVASIYGNGILEFIDEKTVVFGPGPKDCNTTGKVDSTDGWKCINKVWCSNDFWLHRRGHVTHYPSQSQSTMCIEAGCYISRYTNSLYCYKHQYLQVKNAENVVNDVDNTLPVIDTHSAVNTINNNNKMKEKGSGGGSNLLPFAEADKLWQLEQANPQNPPRISKTQWKKARKNHMREQEKLALHLRQAQAGEKLVTLH
jgi:hypothetical protein